MPVRGCSAAELKLNELYVQWMAAAESEELVAEMLARLASGLPLVPRVRCSMSVGASGAAARSGEAEADATDPGTEAMQPNGYEGGISLGGAAGSQSADSQRAAHLAPAAALTSLLPTVPSSPTASAQPSGEVTAATPEVASQRGPLSSTAGILRFYTPPVAAQRARDMEVAQLHALLGASGLLPNSPLDGPTLATLLPHLPGGGVSTYLSECIYRHVCHAAAGAADRRDDGWGGKRGGHVRLVQDAPATVDAFARFFARELAGTAADERSLRCLCGPSASMLTLDALMPLVMEVVRRHPGLAFLGTDSEYTQICT